jgi:hypothetical protein
MSAAGLLAARSQVPEEAYLAAFFSLITTRAKLGKLWRNANRPVFFQKIRGESLFCVMV